MLVESVLVLLVGGVLMALFIFSCLSTVAVTDVVAFWDSKRWESNISLLPRFFALLAFQHSVTLEVPLIREVAIVSVPSS